MQAILLFEDFDFLDNPVVVVVAVLLLLLIILLSVLLKRRPSALLRLQLADKLTKPITVVDFSDPHNQFIEVPVYFFKVETLDGIEEFEVEEKDYKCFEKNDWISVRSRKGIFGNASLKMAI